MTEAQRVREILKEEGADQIIYDDPRWEFIVRERLKKYIDSVRKWWENCEKFSIETTGVFPVQEAAPEAVGLMYRVTKSSSKSPIKHVQIFPFVPTSYLQISGVAGGVVKMIERVCAKGIEIDEFTIVEKHNLPSTYCQGQFVAFIPTSVLQGSKQMGRYVYLTVAELAALTQSTLPSTVVHKAINHIKTI